MKKLGFKIAAPALALYVYGDKASSKEQKGGVVRLIDGELDKARIFAEQVVKFLQ